MEGTNESLLSIIFMYFLKSRSGVLSKVYTPESGVLDIPRKKQRYSDPKACKGQFGMALSNC